MTTRNELGMKILYTSKFKKDYKRMKRQGRVVAKLTATLNMLAAGDPLPARLRDHELAGDYLGHRECHVAPDWLLIYRIDRDRLILTAVRTGSHSELFGK